MSAPTTDRGSATDRGARGRWERLGLVYDPTEHVRDWAQSHACVPTALALPDGERVRVYHAPRNARGQSIPTYFDVAADDPKRVLHVAEAPIMDLGELGTFDDGGIMPCSALWVGGEVYLYYVGWNPSVSVAYRNAVGLAISRDGGRTFERPYPGAVVDRSLTEPFFTASPFVMRERGGGGGTGGEPFRMYYASGTGFLRVADRVEPLYEVMYAESDDGVTWRREGRPLLTRHHDREATARPSVVPAAGGGYDMYFTYRGSDDFRDGADAYRIGYAYSEDGRAWTRDDGRCGIGVAPGDAWDSTMLTYPSVVDVAAGRYLFYNGNGFGRTGIGVARWVRR